MSSSGMEDEISSSKSRKLWQMFRNERGAIDLASIMVGVIVIGLIGGVVSATVFAVIPWAQDNAAKQQLNSLHTAQAAYKAKSSDPSLDDAETYRKNSYGTSQDLQNVGMMASGENYCTSVTETGYVAFSLSASGQVFKATDMNTQPVLHNVSPSDARLPGCAFLGAILPSESPTDKTKTIFTYKCDNDEQGRLPFQNIQQGTLKVAGSDGTNLEKTYSNAVTTEPVTLKGGVEYKVTLDGKFTTLSQLHSIHSIVSPECIRSFDHWGSDTRTVMAESGLEGATNVTRAPFAIPSSVTSLKKFFSGATSFNDPSVSSWDISNVNNLAYAFHEAHSFNQPLNNWDTSKVVATYSTFRNALTFNQPLDKWDTSKITDIDKMFWGAAEFNQNLNSWDTSKVTHMGGAFMHATKFNQPLNDWDVSRATNISSLFAHATTFNQPLDKWDVSNVETMYGVFWDTSFNHDISKWDTSNVTTMRLLFANTPFDHDISQWDTSKVESMKWMFANTPFNQDISNWNVQKVTDVGDMFHGAKAFSYDLSSWTFDAVPLYENFAPATFPTEKRPHQIR